MPEGIDSDAIAWKLIRSSTDMLQRWPGASTPNPFRSSLAIYAYEPDPEGVPEAITCDARLVYLKVSCSITGYQPDLDEQEQVIDLLSRAPDVQADTIEQITRTYLGCYGVLLHVAVYPDVDRHSAEETPPSSYPRIVDFEPKSRDLIQSASATGEMLTTSSSGISTDRSLATVDKTENTWKVGTQLKVPLKGIAKSQLGLTGETGHTRTLTESDNWKIKSTASEERKLKEALNTKIEQLYSLLTGYHVGTNRASFILLPRPHTLQPTEYRTFVQGLRAIEGVQEFFLIVAMPKEQERLGFGITLQTGHFPEDSEIAPADDSDDIFERKSIELVTFNKVVDGRPPIAGAVWSALGSFIGQKHNQVTEISSGAQFYDLQGTDDGWEIDTEKGDPGHAGVVEHRHPADNLQGAQHVTLDPHVYRRSESGGVEIHLGARNATTTSYVFSRRYEVFLRRRRSVMAEATADTSRMLVTQRGLAGRIRLGGCLHDDPLTPLDEGSVVFDEVAKDNIIDEPVVETWRRPGRSVALSAAAVVDGLRDAMHSSDGSLYRHKVGPRTFVDTVHFHRMLERGLSEDVLSRPAANFAEDDGHMKLPDDMNLRELLRTDIDALARRLDTTVDQVRAVRRALFRRIPDSRN